MLLHEVDAHGCKVYTRFVADFANENINRSFRMPRTPVLLDARKKLVRLLTTIDATLKLVGPSMNLPMSTHCRLVWEAQMAPTMHASDRGFGHGCSAL